jgi:hypothetical protein
MERRFSTTWADILPPEILDEIFRYIGDSRVRKSRAGYTYELGSDDEEVFDEDDEWERYGMEEACQRKDAEPTFHLEEISDRAWGDEVVLTKHSMAQFEVAFPLRPLLLVCKAWRGVAERRLYSSISIGCEYEDTTGLTAAMQLERLLDTLNANWRLAALVTELRFTSMNCDKEESTMQTEVMSLCPNVAHFTLSGYNGFVLEKYHAALAKWTHLKTIIIHRYDLVLSQLTPKY